MSGAVNKRFTLWFLVALLAGMFAGWMICGSAGRVRTHETVTTVSDTVVLHDTIIERVPVFRDRRTVDTVLVPQLVTELVTDTVFVELPIEQRHYCDSAYEAWVSGYRPQLDSIRIYSPVRMITTETTALKVRPVRRWGIGIQAGYGAYAAGSVVHLTPYVGIGVSYNLFTF